MEAPNAPQQNGPQHTDVSDIGEFGLIAVMRDTLGPSSDDDLVSGIGDDTAVYRVGNGRVHLLTTDALTEGIHFDRAFMPMEHLGFKALSVNVSDVVAMNAAPRYATVTIGLSQNVTVEMVETIYEGVREACDAYDLTVVGGDTTSAHALSLSVTVVGEADEDAVVHRSGARVGDKLCVTGDVGASYAGLKVLARNRRRMEEQGEDFQPSLDPYSYVIRRHLAPPAQLKTVRDWAAASVQPHALIDVSDGVASEVHHVCEASEVGAQLYEPALPIDPETRNTATDFGDDVSVYALFGGEDYELIFTIPEEGLDGIDPQSYTVIGDIVEPDDPEYPVLLQRADGENVPLQPGGFDHFDEDA
jgi:thiamine-monophosphate kinase